MDMDHHILLHHLQDIGTEMLVLTLMMAYAEIAAQLVNANGAGHKMTPKNGTLRMLIADAHQENLISWTNISLHSDNIYQYGSVKQITQR